VTAAANDKGVAHFVQTVVAEALHGIDPAHQSIGQMALGGIGEMDRDHGNPSFFDRRVAGDAGLGDGGTRGVPTSPVHGDRRAGDGPVEMRAEPFGAKGCRAQVANRQQQRDNNERLLVCWLQGNEGRILPFVGR
jgi:hypothetical protein